MADLAPDLDARTTASAWVALVPARSQSKSIPRKNLQEVGGVSLLARAIGRARAARAIQRVIVSTDSAEFARHALAAGAEAPFLRPAALAGDETPMLAVLAHAWRWLGDEAIDGRRPRPAGLVLLQPSSPFVAPETIDQAVAAVERTSAPLLKAVRRVREHPRWMLAESEGRLVPAFAGGAVRRQDLPPLWIPCGAVYVYRAAWLDAPEPEAAAAWIELGWPESLDVDEPEDLDLAKLIAGTGLDLGRGAQERSESPRRCTLSPRFL